MATQSYTNYPSLSKSNDMTFGFVLQKGIHNSSTKINGDTYKTDQ